LLTWEANVRPSDGDTPFRSGGSGDMHMRDAVTGGETVTDDSAKT